MEDFVGFVASWYYDIMPDLVRELCLRNVYKYTSFLSIIVPSLTAASTLR